MRTATMIVAGVLMLAAGAVQADVFNMGGGLTSLETVPVGDAGNAADTRYETPGYGAVAYTYNIGTYEVTNAQYREFLNAVAAAGDANKLYNTNMAGTYGGIARGGSGTGGDPWVYTAKGGDSNWDGRPVNYVDWYDSLRFANWLHNGQPAGQQDATTTENGSYDMSLGGDVARKPGATWVLPTEDEWYKAAYYDPNKPGGAGYWDYPTGSDTTPTAEAPAGTDLANGSANYLINHSDYVDPVYYATEVGAYMTKPSDSAYGTFDQGGNLLEWNEALIGSYRGLRGGSFVGGGSDLRALIRVYYHPAGGSEALGFRVSEVPEPASMAVLALLALSLPKRGGLAVLRKRRK